VGLVCAPKEKRTKMAAREVKIMSSAGIDLDVAFAAFVKWLSVTFGEGSGVSCYNRSNPNNCLCVPKPVPCIDYSSRQPASTSKCSPATMSRARSVMRRCRENASARNRINASSTPIPHCIARIPAAT